MYEDIYRLSHSRVDTVEEKHLSLYLQINVYIKMQWILSIKKNKKKIQWTHVFVYLFIHAIDYLHVKIRLFDFKRFYMDSKDVCARVLSLLLKLYF